jgi:hypothetical protein
MNCKGDLPFGTAAGRHHSRHRLQTWCLRISLFDPR